MEDKRSYTKITLNVYTAIRLLIKGGATNSECAEYMHVSVNTVSRIRNSDSYDAYRSAAKAAGWMKYGNRKKEEQKPEVKPEVKPESTAPQVIEHKQTVTVPWQVTQEIRRTNELLESISRKLAFIVDELTTTPCKEGKNDA